MHLWGFLKKNVYKNNRHTIKELMQNTNRMKTNFKRHCGNCSPGCIRHDEKTEYMHRWTQWTLRILNTTLLLFSRFSVIYFFTNTKYVKNALWLFRHSVDVTSCEQSRVRAQHTTVVPSLWIANYNPTKGWCVKNTAEFRRKRLQLTKWAGMCTHRTPSVMPVHSGFHAIFTQCVLRRYELAVREKISNKSRQKCSADLLKFLITFHVFPTFQNVQSFV